MESAFSIQQRKQGKERKDGGERVCVWKGGCVNPLRMLEQNIIDRWLINNRNLLLTVLETTKSKIKVLADSMSGKVQCLC